MTPDIHSTEIHGDSIQIFGDHGIGKAEFPAPLRRRRQTVLMLMSNPRGTAGLRLDEEYRAIDAAIVKARYGNRLDLRPAAAVRHGDLHELFVRYKPTVVHYSGHNSAEAGIVLADERGDARPAAPEALSGLFRIVSDSIRLVVLNACLTENQAKAIVGRVPCVVAMSRAVLDSVAIAFSSVFYNSIAGGRPVGFAFELACNRLGFDTNGTHRDLAPVGGDPLRHQTIPVLLSDPRVAEREVITS